MSAEEGKAMVQLGLANMEAMEGELMHESLPITYPDAAVARYCEERATAIKRLLGKGVCIAAQIGAMLEEVKGILPHGLWGLWLDHHFAWSVETARKYRLLAREVDHNPRILQFQSIELAVLFPTLPEPTQQAILDENAVRLSDATAIISRHRVAEWRAEVEQLVRADPGCAHLEIELAMDDPELRDAAAELLRRYAQLFGRLADRDPAEIQAEAGLSLRERLPARASGRVTAQLMEENGEMRLVVWVGGPETIAVFPRTTSPAASAWQSRIVQLVVEETGARTLDHLREVL